MTKEDIDKAAIKNIEFQGKLDLGSIIENSCRESFVLGAEWRIDSVWHKNIQNGKTKKPILVKFDNGLFNLFEDIRDLKGIEDKVSIFAYIEDLLPNKEDLSCAI